MSKKRHSRHGRALVKGTAWAGFIMQFTATRLKPAPRGRGGELGVISRENARGAEENSSSRGVLMAGMPLFAHVGREKSTPPPLSVPLELMQFCGGSKTQKSLFRVVLRRRTGLVAFCLFCSAKHAKTRAKKPRFCPNFVSREKSAHLWSDVTVFRQRRRCLSPFTFWPISVHTGTVSTLSEYLALLHR